MTHYKIVRLPGSRRSRPWRLLHDGYQAEWIDEIDNGDGTTTVVQEVVAAGNRDALVAKVLHILARRDETVYELRRTIAEMIRKQEATT